ncbi:flavodoxin domain-containing protein [Streptomyces sp. NBC_01410]|uniref:flavodoxin domain-containing protein n=1 Tax=Streptomyces sp. NBC_01410 TaxID=2903856 RepID=UPI0038657978
MTRTVLVAYGSKKGSTAEIAQFIASILRDEGVKADARPAAQVCDIRPYEAVVLGGALRMGRWHRDARRFARRHRHALAGRPLWLFSSGPLDPSALERDIPAVRGVRQVERRLGALEHVTFGGRPTDGARGRIARAILEEDGDDCRDFKRIALWAESIAACLTAIPKRGRAGPVGAADRAGRPFPGADRMTDAEHRQRPRRTTGE